MNELIDNLLMLIKEAKYPVVLTGAGMSTESGVPDFRSESGWWRRMDPTTVATIDALENNYQVFRELYKHRILVTKGKKVLINLDKTCFDDEFDLVINDKVGEVLLSLREKLYQKQ